MSQDFDSWFVDYPSTHIKAGESVYARLVASGCLTPAIRGLIEARDLLIAVDHPAWPMLATAAREAALAQQALREDATPGSVG